ncbi:MAG: maltose alpha-D-glucosyltransferase [Chloroflexota bacterium]|nr:maltose alpha-D-glucosyltransferase [Chloroflexota bacterium]
MTKKNMPWYMNAIFYEVHIRAYCDSTGDGKGDIPGLISKLDYIKDLGVDCIWILPIYPSPLKDDGYDIADFYGVHPDYGTIDDFESLVEEAHKRNIKIIADLVLNHTSDQHPWFQESRSDPNSKYRDYYVWSDTDEKYADARIIFLDTEDSNWTYDEKAGMYFWHRFYSSQPDLNYNNPEVVKEMMNVMDFWLDKGIDGFRADAVPYLIEREGTNCENLPETHEILKNFRRHMDEKYEGKILLAEANQWPVDVRPYFGDGDEFHMGFNFPIMPRLFMAIRKGDASPIHWIMSQTPEIPENTQWCTFLRNHDELTLEMVTEEERQWMWSEYAPNPRMRLNLGIRRRLAPLLDNDHRKILLANALLYALPGAPIIYYGDEIGMGDNIWLFDRNGVRTPMQWDDSLNAGFSNAKPEDLYAPVIDTQDYTYKKVNVSSQSKNPESLLNKMRHLVKVRKSHPIFAVGEYEFLAQDQTEFLVILRTLDNQNIICIHNLTGEEKTLALDLSNFSGSLFIDLIDNEDVGSAMDKKQRFEMAPYQFLWMLITN